MSFNEIKGLICMFANFRDVVFPLEGTVCYNSEVSLVWYLWDWGVVYCVDGGIHMDSCGCLCDIDRLKLI